MHLKNISKRALLIIVCVVFAVSAAFLLYFIFGNSAQKKLASPVENSALLRQEQAVLPAQANFGLPLRLKIPSISVDAAINPVGILSNGEMGAPKGPADVAWFDLGPRPGENGNAVISGHYGTWKNGGGSVFDNLNKLRKGDKIYIEDGKGITVVFAVRESKIYDPSANASSVFIANDGKAHLNIITCEGTWNEASKTYSKRLVVFADKE